MKKVSIYILVNCIKPLSKRCHGAEQIGSSQLESRLLLIVYYTILSGSTADDIRIACGISRPSFYRCIHLGISLIFACPELQINFPTSAKSFDAAAAAF
jgi:hypothetical protein